MVFQEFVLYVIAENGLLWQDDFVLGKKLGEGSFGVVYRVTLAKKPSSKVLLLLWIWILCYHS